MASRKSQQNSAASVLDGYEPLEVIGSGTFGLIRKVKRISDGKIFARKELQFDRMTDRDRKQIVAEVNILRGLQHENIVKYEERFIDRENQILYIVMEYCEGGDLGSTIKKCRKTNTLLPEEMVWSYVSQMVLGLDACHYRGSQPSSNSGSASPTEDMAIPASAVLHRDLKPENVFLDGNQNIKIGDFGLSKEVAAQSFACTYVGTPYYMSPELATGSPYDIKADIWALGCIAFELCALAPPFDAQDQAELTRKIKLGHIPELPRGYSSDLGNLIRSMMDLNPKRRPTTKHLLREHPIRLACRTAELSTLSRKIAMEKTRLRAQYYELEMRERAISAREQEMISRQASSIQEREQEERLMALEERERHLEMREQAVMAREQRLEQIKIREGGEEDRAKGRPIEEVNRERASSHYASSSGIRRPMIKRISSGAVARVGGEGGVEVRPAIVTPRSYKAEAVRQRFGKPAAVPSLGPARAVERSSRQRTNSEGSEEWIDNEGEVDSEARSLESSDNEAKESTVTRAPRYSSTASVARAETNTVDESTKEITERYSIRNRSTRKSITTMPTTARSWVNEIIKGCNADLGEDVSMRDASAFLIGSEDKENQHVTAATDKGQSLPTMGEEVTVVKANRPSLVNRTTIATEPVNGTVSEGLGLMAPALYDLSNDEDLPSPFLRKVTRQNNEVLAKRGAKNGTSNLVGPANFLARAAAAGAARQSLAVGVSSGGGTKDSEASATATKVIAPLRRQSVVSTAPTAGSSRFTLPTSSSLTDMKSNELIPPQLTKRRSSALPGSIGIAPIKSSTAASARKSCLPAVSPAIRQRAA